MAEAAIKAAVDTYIGSLITLTTKSGMRYEGSLHHVDAQECTIALRNVKSFGTEGRRDGFVVSPSDKIYEYVVFQGSDIKDLHVISTPSSQSTPSVLDDPAIIESRDSLPPPMHIGLTSTGAVKVPNLSSAAPSGHPIFSFLHWGLSLSPAHVNVNDTATPWPSYLRGLIGPSEQVSQTQSQNFPPLQHSVLNVVSSREAVLNVGSVPVSVTNEPVPCTSKDRVSRMFPFTQDLVQGVMESSSSASEPQPSGNVEEAEQLLSKPAATTRSYCKDDFYDSFSCNKPDDGSARVKFSDRRKKDSQTFGFAQTYQEAQGQGVSGFLSSSWMEIQQCKSRPRKNISELRHLPFILHLSLLRMPNLPKTVRD